jgi:hypothetical protein
MTDLVEQIEFGRSIGLFSYTAALTPPNPSLDGAPCGLACPLGRPLNLALRRDWITSPIRLWYPESNQPRPRVRKASNPMR